MSSAPIGRFDPRNVMVVLPPCILHPLACVNSGNSYRRYGNSLKFDYSGYPHNMKEQFKIYLFKGRQTMKVDPSPGLL
jgi:hypothetical protein